MSEEELSQLQEQQWARFYSCCVQYHEVWSVMQWSLHFKTACSAQKIWSQIEGYLKMEGYLY